MKNGSGSISLLKNNSRGIGGSILLTSDPGSLSKSMAGNSTEADTIAGWAFSVTARRLERLPSSIGHGYRSVDRKSPVTLTGAQPKSSKF